MKLTTVILPPTPASFRTVAGLPVIVRLVLTAYRSGASRVVALGGGETARLRAVLDVDPRTRLVAICDGPPPDLRDSDFLAILPSDCLVTPAALEAVSAAADRSRALLVRSSDAAIDGYGIVVGPPHLVPGLRSPAGSRLAREEEDRADSPPSRSSPVEGEEVRKPSLLAAEVLDGGYEMIPLTTGWCMRVRDDAGAAAAERRLVSDLRSAAAEIDGPIARLDRALSTRVSRLLVRTPLRPNHITLAGTAVGLLAAWCIARGTYAGGLAGAFLFWLAVIIDGCDGEVARLKMQESRFGHLFDVTTDNVVHAAIFLGIGIGQYRAAPSESHVLLAALLVSGLALSLVASYVCLIRHPPVRRLAPQSRRGKIRKRLLLVFESVMNRDFAYLLLPLAVLGRLHWFLWGAGFGSHAFSIGLFLVYRWREAE